MKCGMGKKERKDKRKKKDKKRKRSSSSSSSSSSSLEDDSRYKHSIEARMKVQKKSQKKVAKVANMLGYNNDTNPFGDSNLLQPFTWSKKVEKKKTSTESTPDERLELLKDIERVRRRRDEKEKEQQEKDRLRAEEQRLRDMTQYGDWEKKEEEFHIKQTSVRSKIRLIENRSQPIDLLAKNLLLIETLTIMTSNERDVASGVSGDVDLNNNLVAQLDIDLTDPISIIDNLHVADFDKLLEDIDSYIQLEGCKTKKDDLGADAPSIDYKLFWENMMTVTLHEKDKRINMSDPLAAANNKVINKSVKDDVAAMIQGKSLVELASLSLEIQQSVREGTVSDVSYWDIIQKEIVLQKAKIEVAEVHGYLLKQQHEYLALHAVKKEEMSSSNQIYNNDDEIEYRPENTEDLNLNLGLTADGDSEEIMKSWDEVNVTNRVYNWADKYKPRKPRYFNSIRSGWDWNKYNQTHYDQDNPPPKVIQGYKFCIFYPDLIDKTKTPKYIVEGCDDPQYAIIRFQAGPPYEDIAFKIVNKEWDTGRKYSGFKSVFDRGVLHVHFNFKRLFYRR